MKLALDSAVLARVEEVPIASGAAVVSPMWNCRHVPDDRVDGDFSFVVISEVLAPCVNLFLSGGIPRHFTAERIRLRFPMIGPRLHRSFELRRLVALALSLEVIQNRDENVTFHLPKLSQLRGELRHRQRRLIGMIEIPIPRMKFHEAMMISSE